MSRGKDQSATASDALNQAKSIMQKVSALDRQVIDQRLLTQALWEVVKTKLEFSDDDLLKMFRKLEEAQKESASTAALCPNCSRALQEDSSLCIYCGAQISKQSLF